MTKLTLDHARTIIAAAFDKAAAEGFKPLAVAVLDAGGHTKAFERQDGASNARYKLAFGKANGCLAMGLGGRELHRRVQERPYFLGAVSGMVDGGILPVPGGVLIRDGAGEIIGAAGITGDTSENDEACAVAGIEAAGFTPDTGGA